MKKSIFILIATVCLVGISCKKQETNQNKSQTRQQTYAACMQKNKQEYCCEKIKKSHPIKYKGDTAEMQKLGCTR